MYINWHASNYNLYDQQCKENVCALASELGWLRHFSPYLVNRNRWNHVRNIGIKPRFPGSKILKDSSIASAIEALLNYLNSTVCLIKNNDRYKT